jgi:lysozyme family protein
MTCTILELAVLKTSVASLLTATLYQGNTSSGISYQLREIYTPYAVAAGTLLHINGKFTMGKFKLSL